jgi:hypothetical protein
MSRWRPPGCTGDPSGIVLEARYHLILANAAQASSEFTLDQAAAMTTAIAPTTTSVTAHIKSKLIQFFRSAARPTRR